MKLSELKNLIHEEVKTHLSEIKSGRSLGKKQYLRVDRGSRGEIDGVELVRTSFSEVEEDFDKYVKNSEEEGDYIGEWAFCYEVEEKGLIEVAFDEETGVTYLDYKKYKERIDEILENEDDDGLIYDLLDEVETDLNEIRSGRKYLFKPKDETTRPPKKRKPM